MIIHNFEQCSEEWFQVRLGKFTASNMRVFYGNSDTRKKALIEKACERITKTRCDSKKFSNKHMERGILLEPDAATWYEMKRDCVVEKVGFIEVNSYIGCSPDGFVGLDGGIEIKSPDNHIFLSQCESDKIPLNYFTQIQFCLMCTEKEWWDYVCYNPNFPEPLYIKRVLRDETEITKIKEAIERANEDVNKIVEEYYEKNK